MKVTYSETVILDNTGGPPVLTIVVGSTEQETTFISGSNSDNLTFAYTIQAGENDTDGISISTNALELPTNTTLKDSTGNLASITHDAVTHNAEYKVDTTTPSVSSFTMSDTEIKIGDTPTVTLAFSEAVIGFSSSADITIASLDNGTASGSLSTMSSTDNESWTGTFTPTSNIEDATNTLSLAINSYTDLAGNNGPASTTLNYEIHTLAPTVDNFTMSDTELKIGDTATVTLTFSEAVTGFSNDDITIASLDNGTSTGALSTMTSSNNSITWTGTFTPTDDIEDNTSVLTLGTSYTCLLYTSPSPRD